MHSNVWFIVNLIVFFFTLLFFVLSSFTDPGYLYRPKELDFLVRVFHLKCFRKCCKTLILYYYALTVK